mgnify:CR=1 FL=1
MWHFFLCSVFTERQQGEQALRVVEGLEECFGDSLFLLGQKAVSLYHLRNFDAAQAAFITLRERDPFRIEHMDIYSNVLYVKEAKAGLSTLAHECTRAEKYRPETCVIVGNYYSLKGQHEKAVTYFQRALKLNRKFLSAWTLMGHEFVEMKNTGAAIESYRRAVDINARDYRAWYGLGQVYEIQGMLLYSLYYYRKATALRPYDARMWTAVGGSYLALNKRSEAIKAFERACSMNDAEGIATKKLAKLYRDEGHKFKAAQCYRSLLQDGDDAPLDSSEAEAILFLARFEYDTANLNQAANFCSRLLEWSGPEKEEARGLLRVIRQQVDFG